MDLKLVCVHVCVSAHVLGLLAVKNLPNGYVPLKTRFLSISWRGGTWQILIFELNSHLREVEQEACSLEWRFQMSVFQKFVCV